jgi:glutamine amidotransferase
MLQKKIRDTKLDTLIKEEAALGKPIMGICLGMQMLFEKSYEYGEHQGLSLINGEIVPIDDVVTSDLKIPHIGWNALNFSNKDSQLFKYIKDGDFVYFVHSYFAANCDEAVIATAEYGKPLTAAVENKNVFGCQFHPEKSGEVGLKILKAFCELK